MPSVATTGGVKATATATVIIANTITQAQLVEFNQKLVLAEGLAKQLKPLEDFIEEFTGKVMETATGLSKAGYKALDETELALLVSIRLTEKKFTLEEGVFDFCIKQSSNKRNVQWKNEFIKVKSESAAEAILNQTKPCYSYKIVPIQK